MNKLLYNYTSHLIIYITGELRAIDKLDREQVASYDLVITAKDKGTPSLKSSVHCKITVTDVNDNRPQFEKTSYDISVYENTPSKTKILDIRATDADINDNGKVSYRIKTGPGSTAFSINSLSGELRTVSSLDRETTPSYKLIVEARDQGTPRLLNSVAVNIKILDINDNNPVIKKPLNLKQINESVSIGFKIGKIEATDADEGLNGQLVYSLTEQRNSDFFRIDSSSGEVFLKNRVDRETQDSHRLTITVADKGNPVLWSDIEHDIKILDDNDNEPVFGKSSYSGM